jgi:SnoaL-like polyketide cyclase
MTASSSPADHLDNQLLDQLESGLREFPQRWIAGAGEVSDFFARWDAGWNTHDLDDLEMMVTEDITWEDPAMHGATVHGRAEFRSFTETFFRAFPDVHLEGTGELYLALEGRGLALPWRMTGTFTGELAIWSKDFGSNPVTVVPTGKRFELEGVDLYDFRDGLICDYTIQYDLLGFSQQLGLLG